MQVLGYLWSIGYVQVGILILAAVVVLLLLLSLCSHVLGDMQLDKDQYDPKQKYDI